MLTFNQPSKPHNPKYCVDVDAVIEAMEDAFPSPVLANGIEMHNLRYKV